MPDETIDNMVRDIGIKPAKERTPQEYELVTTHLKSKMREKRQVGKTQNQDDRQPPTIDDIISLYQDIKTINPNQFTIKGEEGKPVFGLGLCLEGQQFLLLSTGEIIQPIYSKELKMYSFEYAERKYCFKTPMSFTENQLSLEGIKRFKSEEQIDGKELFSRAIKAEKNYFDFDERDSKPDDAFKFFTTHAFHSYFLMLIGSTSYWFPRGSPGTGKSISTSCWARLAFKGKFFFKPTPSTVYRLVHENMSSISVDEFDKLRDETRLELEGLFDAGNTKDAVVPRTNDDGTVTEFRAFSAKSFNANDLRGTPAFRTRCFEQTTIPTDKKLEDWYTRSEEQNDELNDLRDDAWLWAIQNAERIAEELEKIKQETRDGKDASSREKQLCAGLLAVVRVIAPNWEDDFIDYYFKAYKEKTEEMRSTDRAYYLNLVIREKIDEKKEATNVKIGTKELAEALETKLLGEGLLGTEDKITTTSIAKMLKTKLKVGVQQKNIGTGKRGFEFSEKDKELLDRYFPEKYFERHPKEVANPPNPPKPPNDLGALGAFGDLATSPGTKKIIWDSVKIALKNAPEGVLHESNLKELLVGKSGLDAVLLQEVIKNKETSGELARIREGVLKLNGG